MKITTLCYIEHDGQYLMLHRIKKENDINEGKWIGVGGHAENGESPEECLLREVKEETGLTIQSPQLCGVKQFQDKQGARYVVMLYKTNHFSGTLQSSAEGEVYWINRHELLQLPLADDFAEMIAVFEKEDLSECFYEQTTDARWQLKLF